MVIHYSRPPSLLWTWAAHITLVQAKLVWRSRLIVPLSATLKIFTWGSWSEMLCGLLPVSLESACFISYLLLFLHAFIVFLHFDLFKFLLVSSLNTKPAWWYLCTSSWTVCILKYKPNFKTTNLILYMTFSKVGCDWQQKIFLFQDFL